MRRCLDCGKLIDTGSRCEPHRLAHERGRERARGPRRSSYSRNGWAREVKDRDGWRCRIAGCQTPTDRVQAHHRVPLSAGGSDAVANGITLCHAHHLAAHDGAFMAATGGKRGR